MVFSIKYYDSSFYKQCLSLDETAPQTVLTKIRLLIWVCSLYQQTLLDRPIHGEVALCRSFLLLQKVYKNSQFNMIETSRELQKGKLKMKFPVCRKSMESLENVQRVHYVHGQSPLFYGICPLFHGKSPLCPWKMSTVS